MQFGIFSNLLREECSLYYNINYNGQRRGIWYFMYECNYIVNMLIIPEITPVTLYREYIKYFKT